MITNLTGEYIFTKAVIVTANQVVDIAKNIMELVDANRDKINGLGRATASTIRIHKALMVQPIVTSGWLEEKTGITPATVNKSLRHLEHLGIVKELTSQKRKKLYS